MIIIESNNLVFSAIKEGEPFRSLDGKVFIKLDRDYYLKDPGRYVSYVNAINITNGQLFKFNSSDSVTKVYGAFVENCKITV